jgi:hypothetical protein
MTNLSLYPAEPNNIGPQNVDGTSKAFICSGQDHANQIVTNNRTNLTKVSHCPSVINGGAEKPRSDEFDEFNAWLKAEETHSIIKLSVEFFQMLKL